MTLVSFEYLTINTSNYNVGKYYVKDDDIPDFDISNYWGWGWFQF
jgi:hypothetical protein